MILGMHGISGKPSGAKSNSYVIGLGAMVLSIYGTLLEHVNTRTIQF